MRDPFAGHDTTPHWSLRHSTRRRSPRAAEAVPTYAAKTACLAVRCRWPHAAMP
jgi:hypothetical protein